MSKTEPRRGNIDQIDSCQMKAGSVEWWKEGEGSIQRTCMNDP